MHTGPCSLVWCGKIRNNGSTIQYLCGTTVVGAQLGLRFFLDSQNSTQQLRCVITNGSGTVVDSGNDAPTYAVTLDELLVITVRWTTTFIEIRVNNIVYWKKSFSAVTFATGDSFTNLSLNANNGIANFGTQDWYGMLGANKYLNDTELTNAIDYYRAIRGVPVKTAPCFYCIGQSNMTGRYTYTSGITRAGATLRNVRISLKNSPGFAYHKIGGVDEWAYNNDYLRVGPEATFLEQMAVTLDTQVFGIKSAYDGSGLDGDPGNDNDWWDDGVPGERLIQTMQIIRQKHQWLVANGFDPVSKGVLWYQGETDSVHSYTADNYYDYMKLVIAYIRSELGVPNLPFVLVKLYNNNAGAFPYMDTVNDALLAISGEDQYVQFVDPGTPVYVDDVHIDADSQLIVGEAAADAMVVLTGEWTPADATNAVAAWDVSDTGGYTTANDGTYDRVETWTDGVSSIVAADIDADERPSLGYDGAINGIVPFRFQTHGTAKWSRLYASGAAINDIFSGGGGWFRFFKFIGDNPAGDFDSLVNKSAWNIYIGSASGGLNDVRMTMTYASGYIDFVTDDKIMDPGEHATLALTLDSDSNANLPVIYKNGVPQALTANDNASSGAQASDAAAAMAIGGFSFTGLTDTNAYEDLFLDVYFDAIPTASTLNKLRYYVNMKYSQNF